MQCISKIPEVTQYLRNICEVIFLISQMHHHDSFCCTFVVRYLDRTLKLLLNCVYESDHVIHSSVSIKFFGNENLLKVIVLID